MSRLKLTTWEKREAISSGILYAMIRIVPKYYSLYLNTESRSPFVFVPIMSNVGPDVSLSRDVSRKIPWKRSLDRHWTWWGRIQMVNETQLWRSQKIIIFCDLHNYASIHRRRRPKSTAQLSLNKWKHYLTPLWVCSAALWYQAQAANYGIDVEWSSGHWPCGGTIFRGNQAAKRRRASGLRHPEVPRIRLDQASSPWPASWAPRRRLQQGRSDQHFPYPWTPRDRPTGLDTWRSSHAWTSLTNAGTQESDIWSLLWDIPSSHSLFLPPEICIITDQKRWGHNQLTHPRSDPSMQPPIQPHSGNMIWLSSTL